jgi:hypothetical protein
MCNESGLVPIFGQFSGSEITMTPSKRPDENDPVVAAMRTTAENNGYHLRLWVDSNPAATAGYDAKRANIHIEHHLDGKFRVGSYFHVG